MYRAHPKKNLKAEGGSRKEEGGRNCGPEQRPGLIRDLEGRASELGVDVRFVGAAPDLLAEYGRAELQVTIMAEAKLAARAELEERLQEERAAIARAESDARGAARNVRRGCEGRGAACAPASVPAPPLSPPRRSRSAAAT